MSDTITPVDQVDVFTTAVRAVLAEIEYDGHLALPITMAPATNGVRMQVEHQHFAAWCEALAGCEVVVEWPAYENPDGHWQEHLRATGTVNNHDVSIVTVHHLAEKPAVA